MSTLSVNKMLVMALILGSTLGCSLKSSKPAADITLVSPAATVPNATSRSQESFATGALKDGGEQSAASSPLLTDTGANTNIRSGDVGSAGMQPAAARASQTVLSPIPYKRLTAEHRPRQCKEKDCPSLKIKWVEFSGQPKFNAFLDSALATMAGVDQDFVPPYRNLKELSAYFIQTAKRRQTIDLQSDVVRATNEMIVVRLDSYLFNGGAHGISATQYVNWVFKTDRLLSLESMLLPHALPKYLAILKIQHAKWLAINPVRQDNPAKYDQVWPFVPSDNVAMMDNGLAVQYDPYSIAPGSFGKPVITIPYESLQGIIRPEILQMGQAPSFKGGSR